MESHPRLKVVHGQVGIIFYVDGVEIRSVCLMGDNFALKTAKKIQKELVEKIINGEFDKAA